MSSREFAFRRSLTWQLWENIALVAVFPAAVIVMGLLGLDLWTTVGFALLFGIVAAFIAWDRVWIFRNFAQTVNLDDTGIDAKPFYGASARIAWKDVVAREEYERRDPFRGVFPQMRLVGRDGSRIVLDGEMTNAEELFEEVRSCTRHASPGGKRRWWERVFLPG